MLIIRGFSLSGGDLNDRLLIPEPGRINEWYRQLKTYSFRIFLRDVIKHQDFFRPEDVARFTSLEVAEKYIRYLETAGLIQHEDDGYFLTDRPVKSFGKTLEWYIAQIFEREFALETLWGKRFKGQFCGGDFDVLSRIENLILYTEVKSSPPKGVYDSEISSYMDRFSDLSPDLSIFFLDTELRMKDKIVPMFEKELKRRYRKTPPVVRMEKELFHINNRIFLVNAKGGIANNLSRVFTWYFRNRNPLTENERTLT